MSLPVPATERPVPPVEPRVAQDWRLLLALYFVTSVVEAIGVSQVFAFMPLELRALHLPEAEIPQWVGLLGSLVFILGLPIVPLWGVWADKYSRKAVIVRSAVVEAVVFAGVALSREPWQFAASLLLVGLQLGNTGVMLAAIRDTAPRERLGTAIALFGASGPIGFSVGPTLGGFMVDGLQLPLTAVYWSSAGLSVAVVVMLLVFSREVRPDVIPEGRVLRLAFGAVRGVFTDWATLRLFAIFGVAIVANQMTRPFMPLVVEQANGGQVGLASAIGLVLGTAALAGALVAPLSGALGDRLGFRPVLAATLVGSAVALATMPALPGVPPLAITAMAYAALNASVSAMIFGLLAVEVAPERRSATLNLVYLPLYLGGIVGPAVGSAIITVGGGVPAVFEAGALVLGLGGIALAAASANRRLARGGGVHDS